MSLPKPRRRTVRRWAGVAGALIVMAGIGLTGYVGWERMRPAPVVVVPRDWDRLEPEVRSLIEHHVAHVRSAPRAAESHGTLGLVYEANALWEEAEQSFANAGSLASEQPLWRYHRAVAMAEAGDFEGALKLWRQLGREHPDFAPCHLRLGAALLETGEVGEAAVAFQRVIDLVPRTAHGYVGLGECKVRQGDYAGAAGLLEKGRDRDSGYKSARYLLGLAYRGLGRQEEAEQELKLGAGAVRRYLRDPLTDKMESYSVSVRAQLTRASDLIEAGRPQQAAEVLEAAFASRPDNHTVLNKLAATYFEMNQPVRARALWLKAERMRPGEFRTYMNLASCCIEMKWFEEALRHADRAVAQRPTIGETHFLRARVLAYLGRFAEAVEVLETVEQLDTRDPQVYLALADTCVWLNRYEEARNHYRSAAQVLSDPLTAYIGLCSVCIKLGDPEEAASALTAARELSPDHPEVIKLERLLAQRKGG